MTLTGSNRLIPAQAIDFMKKSIYLLGLILSIFAFISCGDDEDNIDYAWKNQNDQVFNALADSVAKYPTLFEKVSVPQGPGFIYCKKIAKEGVSTDIPKYTSVVRVYYKGQLVDGTIFANPWETAPYDFKIDGGVFYINKIQYPASSIRLGWQVALQNMMEGETWRIWIPYQLGYGTGGSGSTIPGYSTLIFDIKLVKILQMYPLTLDES